jgi:hypothetical protein
MHNRTYGAELNVAACLFDEPEYGKKSADTGRAGYRAYIVGLGQRGSADIGRKLGTFSPLFAVRS